MRRSIDQVLSIWRTGVIRPDGSRATLQGELAIGVPLAIAFYVLACLFLGLEPGL